MFRTGSPVRVLRSMNRPCVRCGVLIPSGSRCADCQRPLNNRYVRGKRGRTSSDWRHRKTSTAQRQRVPFCELRESPACTGKAETLQHVLPISQFPEYVHEHANHRSACRPCNSTHGDRWTEADQEQVLAAIDKRRARHAQCPQNAKQPGW